MRLNNQPFARLINMKSQTLQLFDYYNRLLKEGGDPNQMQEDPNQQPQSPDVTENPEPTPEEVMPMSSEGEEKYISDLVDAALFEPSSEDANTLLNLQSQMQMKKFTNAREEILPTILRIINPSTQGGDLKKEMNRLN